MKTNKKEVEYTGPYFILEHDRLQPGDIILEHGYEPHSEIICRKTGSHYSHAMIYVGGTIIEATTGGGVFSRVPNRSVVRAANDFTVLRLTEFPGTEQVETLCNHARYLVGSQYSVTEAVLVKGPDFIKEFTENSRKQFCSRLVAQCYQKAGINLVSNANFCSPADIEQCGLLQVIPDMVRLASEHEATFALEVSPHASHTENAVRFVKAALSIFKNHGIKTVGTSDGEVVITTLNDISLAVFENRTLLYLDEEITEAMRCSGYLDHIDMDRKQNPFRYDYLLFSYHIAYNADDAEIFERLRVWINKEAEVIKLRLESYMNGRSNLIYNMKYFKAEFSICEALLKGVYDRIVLIERYSAGKRNAPGFREINDMSNKIINEIQKNAPELVIH